MAVVRRTGIILLVLGALLESVQPAHAIPAFARKYGLPCSSCHEAWPKLSNFGQVFRDNGYQLGNDRDSPVYQQPSYFPIMFRTTPQWHRETDNRRAIDIRPGDPSLGRTEARITTAGFDLTGIDIFSAGTLYKNISFGLQPFMDNGGRFHLETAWVRFDNLLGSPWLNFKFGKFELDTLISERRLLTSSNNGFYHIYHYTPTGDTNGFGGLSSNQLGIELLGHSKNSYTRYSVAMLSSNNGAANLPTNHTYDVYADASQGFELPGLGLQRVGVYGYFGKSPTFFQTNNGNAIPGTGSGNRSYSRVGAYGLWYAGKFDFSTFFLHGEDNVFLANGVRADRPQDLPLGATGPSWNGGFVELHYTYNPQLILIGRYELIRMDHRANPKTLATQGNLDSWTVGYRWYPFMSTRAGLAWLQEYSYARTAGAAPISGRPDTNSSYLMGFDFDF